MKSGERYQVVCYMRIDKEDPESLTLAEAVAEARQAQIMQPENTYTIEKITE